MKFVDSYLHYASILGYFGNNIHSFTRTVCRLLTDLRFSAGPTDERYVTGGGGSGRCDTLCQGE